MGLQRNGLFCLIGPQIVSAGYSEAYWLNLKKWADDPNTYEGISPQSIGNDPMMERAAKF